MNQHDPQLASLYVVVFMFGICVGVFMVTGFPILMAGLLGH